MSLRFAMVADTHVGTSRASAERLRLVYAAVARLAPDFVLHCGDITDTGLPGEYQRYRQAVPAALRGLIRHVPGNHDARWDPAAKGSYREHGIRLPAGPGRPRAPAPGSPPGRRSRSGPAQAG